MERLLQDGADVNFADLNLWRPLHEAARRGAADVVAALLAAGADRGAETGARKTALQLAHQFHGSGRADLLEMLRHEL